MRNKRIAEKKSPFAVGIAVLTLSFVLCLQMEMFYSVPSSQAQVQRDENIPKLDDNISLYCKLTNRQEKHMDSRHTFCLTSDAAGVVVSASGEDDFVLAVTVSESKFWNGSDCDLSELSWLQWIGVPTVVVVKSNSTVSFRANGLRWSEGVNSYRDRAIEAMYEPLLSFDASFYHENSSSPPPRVFQSILRSEWHLLQNGASRRCLGGEWLEAMRGTLFLFESPNVGDEALTVVDLAARIAQLDEAHPYAPHHNGNEMNLLDGVLLRARSVIFVHSHQTSWHSVDIIAQLRCLCIDQSVERYKTLTTPERAYLMQCMPLHVSEGDIELLTRNALDGASAAMKRSQEVVAMKRRQAERSVRTSQLFSNAFAFVFDINAAIDIPEAIVRDCCTSLVVSRDALLHPFRATSSSPQTATFKYTSLHRKIMRQPLDEVHYYNASVFQPVGLSVGELSMYLERFWRTLFVATRYDQHRDISVNHCSDRNVHFQCPPTINISTSASLMPEWRARVERDTATWGCESLSRSSDPFN